MWDCRAAMQEKKKKARGGADNWLGSGGTADEKENRAGEGAVVEEGFFT